jgi:hypothetical protein
VSRLDEIGAADSWRCWLCDATVDPAMSVNDARGPSIDSITTKAKSKGGGSVVGTERLAHRACNTKKGAVAPVVPWSDALFVSDPAPILASVERLARTGGREVMARCPTPDDGAQAATWLTGRVSRLAPGLDVSTDVEPGGGQFLLILRKRS